MILNLKNKISIFINWIFSYFSNDSTLRVLIKPLSEKKKEWYSNNPEKHPMWGNTTYIFTSPDGEKFVVSGGVKQWCKDRGLVLSNLIKVASGQRKHCKGWTAKRQ